MKTPLGLIVTYNPSPDFFADLDFFYTQLNQIVVVDNGSNSEVRLLLEQEAQRRKSSLHIIFNKINLGIASALNQGFRWGLEHGYHKVISFDQDSYPAPGMLPVMLNVFSTCKDDGRIAVVAPVIEDTTVEKRSRFLRPRGNVFFEWKDCKDSVLDNVTTVITSGALYDLTVYQQIGPFREDFFIDYVDTEYCLRVRQNGYKIVVACNAFLDHRLGNRQKRFFLGQDHYPTFHSPLRWYYISRNRIQMLKNYAIRFPHWLTYEIVASLYTLFRMLSFETQKTAKLWALIRGTLDGIRGHMGKAPDVVVKKLDR